MAYNPSIDSWIMKSIYRHFDSNKGSFYLYIEETKDDRPSYDQWIELRVNGPDSVEVSKQQYIFTVEIDVLISCKAESDIYLMASLIGLVKAMFTCIPVYDDSSTFVGMLQLAPNRIGEGLRVVRYGRMLDLPRLNTSVSGVYHMQANIT